MRGEIQPTHGEIISQGEIELPGDYSVLDIFSSLIDLTFCKRITSIYSILIYLMEKNN